MAAYNIIVVDAECPHCHDRGLIDAQTHIAASFDGDATGWFCLREYRTGQKMAWWPEGHPRFEAWANATCRHCKTELYAVVEFDAPVVRSVSDLGLERDWPRDLRK